MSETCFNCIYGNGSVCMAYDGCHFEPKEPFNKLNNTVKITSGSCFDCANYSNGKCMFKNGCVFITRESLSGNKSGNDIISIENEKEHLDKLVDSHWKYIEGVLYSAIQYDEATEMDEARIKEIEFHYKSSAKHFWGHCREYHTGETL